MGVAGTRRPLRILHIDPERAWGGGENQVIGLLSYLALWGHENRLLCYPDGLLFQEAQRRGIATLPLRMRNEIDLRPVLPLRRLIRREGYDIVHFHTRRAHALALWLRGVSPKVRFVVTRRMDYPLKGGRYRRYLYNRGVDGVVAISQKIADLLVSGGVKRERIRVIHSGIDPLPYRQARAGKTHSDALVVGTMAVLEERKGHRFLLEAAVLLKRRGYRLEYRFAGEGSERERLERIAIELGLREEVGFVGFVSDAPAFLSAIDIFVLPSLYEGLGVAVLEAMAAGRPVVASRVGGIPELVQDQITGLLVPPKDPEALASAISRLLSQEGLLQEMGSRARGRVERHFTVERMARNNEEYYYGLLELR